MTSIRTLTAIALCAFVFLAGASAQPGAKLGENAALRYWSAFVQMQDAALTDEQVKELNGFLDGSTPYDDSKYKSLVEKNQTAIETMIRGTLLPNCDWGVDNQLGPDAPVDYVRKALALGRLNVLYAFHLMATRDAQAAARTLAGGLTFSHDVANGGTLFATLAAKDLLVAHLRALNALLDNREISPSAAQLVPVDKAIAALGKDGLDWQGAMKREFGVPFKLEPGASAVRARIVPVYLAALGDPSLFPKLEQMMSSAPKPVTEVIPNPDRVLEQKQNLTEKLRQTRFRLKQR
jgi:hypothetical protein